MEQTPEEQLMMLLLSYIPPLGPMFAFFTHYSLFFSVVIIILFLFGCRYFLSMADDYIAKRLAQKKYVSIALHITVMTNPLE